MKRKKGLYLYHRNKMVGKSKYFVSWSDTNGNKEIQSETFISEKGISSLMDYLMLRNKLRFIIVTKNYTILKKCYLEIIAENTDGTFYISLKVLKNGN